MNISVIGAGSWGTALSFVLASNGHRVFMHTRNKRVAEEFHAHHQNSRYLKGYVLPETISATTSMEVCLKDADVVLFVVPSHATRETAKGVKPYLKGHEKLIHATKGFETSSGKRISEILKEELKKDVSVLSGPSHAEEVIQKLPTTVTVASLDEKEALFFQQLFMNEHFRVYTSSDIIGVELGGSFKNVIALGAGILDGLSFGDNAKAALITRGLFEMRKLCQILGGKEETTYGLSGAGDLFVTCSSQHSRNWNAGYLIGQGKTVEDVLQEMNMVVEGIKATKSLYHLAKKHRCELPITLSIYSVLFEGKKPKDAAKELMTRKPTSEI